jgi:hypothetical protein
MFPPESSVCITMSRGIVQAAVALALFVPAVWAQPQPVRAWGPPSAGLQLGVSASAGSTAGAFSVDVSFKNTGPDDVVLNLGHMLANGKVMFPDAVRLGLTDPSGRTCELHYFDRRYPVIRGRVDDFIVALPAEAVYTLRLTSDRLWCAAAREPRTTLPPGRHRVVARFEGTGARTTNLDMKGIGLLAFWKSTIESGQAAFEIGR